MTLAVKVPPGDLWRQNESSAADGGAAIDRRSCRVRRYTNGLIDRPSIGAHGSKGQQMMMITPADRQLSAGLALSATPLVGRHIN